MKIYFVIAIFFSALTSASPSFIEVNGYNIEYEWEKKIAAPIVLLEAGGSAGMADWDPIYTQLSAFASVIRYSRIGNGNSYKLRKNYSSEQYAQEALLLLKALGIKRPVIYIAHSYGAYIARTFAAQYPENLAALMLIEPASEHDVDIMRQIDLPRAEQEIAQIKRDDMANGMSNQYLDFWAKRPLPDYPEIPDIPVTVIASVKRYQNPSVLFFTDEGRKKWGKLHSEWAKAFPRGRVVLTDKSYHYPQFDEPDMVIEEIKALLDRTP